MVGWTAWLSVAIVNISIEFGWLLYQEEGGLF